MQLRTFYDTRRCGALCSALTRGGGVFAKQIQLLSHWLDQAKLHHNVPSTCNMASASGEQAAAAAGRGEDAVCHSHTCWMLITMHAVPGSAGTVTYRPDSTRLTSWLTSGHFSEQRLWDTRPARSQRHFNSLRSSSLSFNYSTVL